jgi:phenylacetate-CoA ligase
VFLATKDRNRWEQARGKSKVGLDAVETASIDELRDLQFRRLSWALRHAYDNMAVYRAKCDAIGVQPGDFKQFSGLRLFPSVTKRDS